MSKQMSILRALRERKTISAELAKASQRISANAVKNEGDHVDFSVEEQLKVHGDKQHELRSLKVSVLEASLKSKVKIPDGISIPEAGQEVPVYQAILIRDDLKGRKSVLGLLENANVNDDNRGFYAMREGQESKKKVRQFDFQKVLAELDQLQSAIDEIDAAIQYVDSTTQISL